MPEISDNIKQRYRLILKDIAGIFATILIYYLLGPFFKDFIYWIELQIRQIDNPMSSMLPNEYGVLLIDAGFVIIIVALIIHIFLVALRRTGDIRRTFFNEF